jgi:DsbC/DsbD-like thiol-disulfide interchange protein
MMKKLTAIALTLGFLGAFVCSAGDTGSASKVKVSVKASQPVSGQQNITLTLSIHKGWHIYANPVKNRGLLTAQTTVKVAAQGQLLETRIAYPSGKLHVEKDAPEIKYMGYENSVDIPLQVQRSANDGPLAISVRFMACDDKHCLPAATKTVMIP